VYYRRNREGFEGFEDAGKYELIMYHAEWCPHCHSALPEFEKLGAIQTIGGKKVELSAIEAEKNPGKVREKVDGYPTIRLYTPEGKVVNYDGPRTAEGLQEFLNTQLK
jgi:thiol-disulfide isomerase/thioredoxin